jgi:tyrosine-protein kinase Etk/Wzc
MQPTFQSPGVVDTIRYLFFRWKLLFGVTFLAAVIAAISALFMPNEYKSTASLFPAQQRSMGLEALIGGRIGSLAGSLIGGGSKSTFDRYYVILLSESVNMEVIERFDLIRHYENEGKQWPIQATIGDLRKNTSFRGTIEGNFVIDVWDKDPRRAKDMADYYVDLLNRKSQEIATTEAREYRLFIEGRYVRGMSDVDSLRSAIANFQRKHGIFELTEQTKEYFKAVGQLYSRKFEIDAEYEFLRQTFDESHSQVRQMRLQKDLMDNSIRSVLREDDPNRVMLNLNTLPDIANTYYDLMMNVEIQTELMKFIVPLYEQAKLEEIKQIPIVSIIDAPNVPYKKDRPFRALIVLATALSTFVLLIFYFMARFTYLVNRDSFRALLRPHDA